MFIRGKPLIIRSVYIFPLLVITLPVSAERCCITSRPADAQPVVRSAPLTGNDSGTDQQSGLRYLYAIPPTPVEQVRPVQGEQPPANELHNFAEPETTDQTLRSNRYPSYFLAPVVPYPVSPGMHQSQSRRNWTNYRYFDGRPSLYGYGRRDPDSTSWYGDAYREGFLRGSDRARFDQQGGERTVRVLGHGHRHIERGKQLFQDRQYSAAADAYKLAADTNHGDPSSRLYAAHALFATGRYRESVQYLRRAFELQPKISMLNFDLRNDYGIRQDYDEHLNNLVAALRQSPRDLDRLLLLGYIRYYSGQRDKAHMPLRAVLKLHPGDSLARQLLENCPVPDVVADQIDQTKQNQ